MGEPLKGKIMYVEELPYKYPNGKDVAVCQVIHIKSTVEWLKCEIKKKGYIDENLPLEICNLIDQAFEDVMK